MIDENAIIYKDPEHATYMITDRKGYITRRATLEELISMNEMRKARGFSEIDWDPNCMYNLAEKRETSTAKRLGAPCPNCGANSWVMRYNKLLGISTHHICEYCGTEV